MRIEVAVLGSPNLIVFLASVDVKQHLKKKSTGTEIRSFVKVEVVDMGSPSLIIRTASVDVKQD